MRRLATGLLLLPALLKAQPQGQLGTGLSGSYSNQWSFSQYETAQGFVAPRSFLLQEAKIHTTWYFTPTKQSYDQGFGGFFKWTLYRNDAVGLPSAVISSGIVVPSTEREYPDIDLNRANDIWTFTLPDLFIGAGQSYSLSVRNTNQFGDFLDTEMYWVHGSAADTLVFTPSAVSQNGAWRFQGPTDDKYWAYGNRVSINLYGTTVVPEPTPFALVGVVLLVAVAVHRRRARDVPRSLIQ
jgi:hypothetical protein